MSGAMEEIESLQEEIDYIRAGADSTPKQESLVPTPGQLWYRLLELDKKRRLALLDSLIEDTVTASRCFKMDCYGRGMP